MTRTILVAALVVWLAAVPVAAHHSYAGVEQTRTLFEARVGSLRIENPHTLIELKAPDGQGMASRIHVGDTLLVSGTSEAE